MNTTKAFLVVVLTFAMALGPMLAYAGPQPSRLVAASNSPGGTVSGYQAESAEADRASVVKLVSEIRRADYEGGVEALARLYRELEPFTKSRELASRVRYWRGFAVWRRAMNAMNEPVANRAAVIEDLELAVEEFKQAYAKDPAFADARIAAAACLMTLVFFAGEDQERVSALVNQLNPLIQEAYKAQPNNPRVLWVVGNNRWWTPPEYGGSQAKGIAAYEQGLEAARRQRGETGDPLEPSWGEPELLMSLAWSHLNGNSPDLDAAERYARAALELVPYWYYVRDILLPQILEAKAEQ